MINPLSISVPIFFEYVNVIGVGIAIAFTLFNFWLWHRNEKEKFKVWITSSSILDNTVTFNENREIQFSELDHSNTIYFLELLNISPVKTVTLQSVAVYVYLEYVGWEKIPMEYSEFRKVNNTNLVKNSRLKLSLPTMEMNHYIEHSRSKYYKVLVTSYTKTNTIYLPLLKNSDPFEITPPHLKTVKIREKNRLIMRINDFLYLRKEKKK